MALTFQRKCYLEVIAMSFGGAYAGDCTIVEKYDAHTVICVEESDRKPQAGAGAGLSKERARVEPVVGRSLGNC